jgi:hypothetical protein
MACGSDSPTTTGDPTLADVVGVEVSGDDGGYTFAVSVRSHETGCDRYADWWEVLAADGSLVYRRILAHSHPTEQPFTRTGGPVAVGADDVVWVRAHLAPGGYGGAVFTGTAAGGLVEGTLPVGLGDGVESAEPQPAGCAF